MHEQLPPSGRQIEISWRDHRATVVEVGGAIRAYQVNGRDVLDGFARHEMGSSGRGQVLMPWPNRLADGRYRFGGEDLQLPLTEPARHNAIHGLVRFANWTVAEAAPDRVVMAHRLHPQPGYPFLLDLSVAYSLGPGGLLVEASPTNRGVRECPYGQGSHPYLKIGDDGIDRLLLRSPATTVYEADDRGLPRGRHPATGTEHDFLKARPIGATTLDTAYTDLVRGPDGHAEVELAEPDGAARITLWLDEGYPNLMLFTGDTLPDPPRRRRGLGVEPMTCAPNAFVSGDGLQVIEPGGTFTAAWGIRTEGF